MKGTDLLISFDTTGSMYPVLSQVRNKVEALVNDLFSSIEDLRVGIITHGDYCDKDNPYTIRIMDLTDKQDDICEFIRTTDKTYGGDADECYELVLNQARQSLSWGSIADREKLMILIGDASPHNTNYPDNRDRLDWEKEAELLRAEGVKVYAVHALSYYRSPSKKFYETVAKITGGVYLTLDQFEEINDLLKITCIAGYSEEKLSEYVSIIRENGRLSNSMRRNINRLQGKQEECGIKQVQKDGLIPVKPGRFQVMTVAKDCAIKDFVQSQGVTFKVGRGFYELTKHETVQQYKEIILQDRETGEMFNGSQVREMLGLQPQIEKGGVKENLSSKNTKDYRLFIQSTSYNRKLTAGTTFMYEIEDLESEATSKKSSKRKKAVKKEVAKAPKEVEKAPKEVEKAPKEVEKSDSSHLFSLEELEEMFKTEESADKAKTSKVLDETEVAERPVEKTKKTDRPKAYKLLTKDNSLAIKLTEIGKVSDKAMELLKILLVGEEITDEELLELIFDLDNLSRSLRESL